MTAIIEFPPRTAAPAAVEIEPVPAPALPYSFDMYQPLPSEISQIDAWTRAAGKFAAVSLLLGALGNFRGAAMQAVDADRPLRGRVLL